MQINVQLISIVRNSLISFNKKYLFMKIAIGKKLSRFRILYAYAYFLVLLLVFYIISCAWTSITSLTDPEFSNLSFRKIMVTAPFSDLEYKQSVEDNFQASLKNLGIDVVRGMDLFLPTREYSTDEMNKILKSNGIESVLIVAFTNYWSSQAYIPGSSSTTGTASLIGNSIYYSSRTRNYGGYYISKPNVTFELRLIEPFSGKTAWIGKSYTRGNAFANFNTLISSLANRTSEKLFEEGLIVKNAHYNPDEHQKVNNAIAYPDFNFTKTIDKPQLRTVFPNFRKSNPSYSKYSDKEILRICRDKNRHLSSMSDNELIKLLENKYAKK